MVNFNAVDVFIITICLASASCAYTEGNGDNCYRTCDDAIRKTCSYTFHVGWYYTMSKACGDCPKTLDNCSQKGCVAADGFPRQILVVNKTLPGPSIEVCKGDRVIVDVVNHLENGEGISIHWHGIYQKNTPYMDGVSMLTQCPILPYTTFRYDFMADHAGTHWWHGHTGLHRADGLFGAFIVRESSKKDLHSGHYNYDLPQHEVLLIDWTHRSSVDEFLYEHHMNSTGSNVPATILINGKASFGNREVFDVEEGSRYRFRVISSAVSKMPMRISVDNHKLILIASDGGDVNETEVDALVIYAGERYDFVLNASQSVDNYWFKVQDEINNTSNQGLAIIRYNGANNMDPTANPSPVREGIIYQKWNTNANESNGVITVDKLTSLDDFNVPQQDIKRVYLGYDFSSIDDPRYMPNAKSPQINSRSFTFQSYTLLSQFNDADNGGDVCSADDDDLKCNITFCLCTQIIQVNLNQIVEIVLIDESKKFHVVHPLHLHGHDFRVLAQKKVGNVTTKEEIKRMDNDGQITRNFDHPPVKDTVITPAAGYTVIQFVADNPGWWFLHCHIDFHVEVYVNQENNC